MLKSDTTYKSNLTLKYELLERLEKDFVKAKEELARGTTFEKMQDVFYLDIAIDDLRYDILNSEY